MRKWQRRIATIEKLLSGAAGVKAERFMPQIAHRVPHPRVDWDREKIRFSPEELTERLRDGEPSIECVPGPRVGVGIASWTLKPGEAESGGERLRAQRQSSSNSQSCAPGVFNSTAPATFEAGVRLPVRGSIQMARAGFSTPVRFSRTLSLRGR